MSSQFEPGSRLVVVLSVIKESGRQINYGSGKKVIDETIQDAGTPLPGILERNGLKSRRVLVAQ